MKRVLVTGVVQSVGGHTGFPKAGDGPTLVLLLTPWSRASDAKPLDRLLRIEIPVAPPAVAQAMKTFEKGATVELELERLDGPMRRQWVGLGRLPIWHLEANPVLETFRQSVDRPTMLEHPDLGPLSLKAGAIIAELNDHQAPDSFEGQVRLGGHACTLSIELTRGSRANTKAARARDRRDLSRAARLVAKLEHDLPDILGAVVRQYLPIYNAQWRAHRPALKATAFRKRLEPSLLWIWSPGSARLLIKTGDLFDGQVVLAQLDKAGVLFQAHLTRVENVTSASEPAPASVLGRGSCPIRVALPP